MLLALIRDNAVVALQSTDSEEEIQSLSHQYDLVIDITSQNPQPLIGWVLDGNHLSDPNGNMTPTRKITVLGLRRRFTFPELLGIENASLNADPSIRLPLKVLLGNLSVANYVDLNRADTVAGIGMLVSLGLITSDRASTILTASIQSDEIYRGDW